MIKRHEGGLYFSKEVTIGNDCFIGARVSLSPGTIIGNNVIIGACSVVKGIIPDVSLLILAGLLQIQNSGLKSN